MNKGVIEMRECTYFLPLTLPFLQFRPPSGLTSSIIHSLQILELNYPNSSPVSGVVILTPTPQQFILHTVSGEIFIIPKNLVTIVPLLCLKHFSDFE